MDLESMTHEQLDAIADERGIDPYPSGGIKADKVAAIEAAAPLETCRAVANAPLSGWPRGEIREVEADDRLLRRAAAGLVTILEREDPPPPHTAVDLDAPPAGADLEQPLEDGYGEDGGEDVRSDAPGAPDPAEPSGLV